MVIAHRTEADSVRTLRKAFRAIDTGGEGYITFRELEDVLQTQGHTTEEIKDIFDAVEMIDDDNDGHVDYEEFVAFVFHQEEAASKLDCRKLKYQISELHDELLDLKIHMGMPLMGDKPSAPSSPKTPKVGLSPLSHRKSVSSRASFSKTGGVTGTKVASVLPMPDFKFKKDKDKQGPKAAAAAKAQAASQQAP